jgi:hypothetical protein
MSSRIAGNLVPLLNKSGHLQARRESKLVQEFEVKKCQMKENKTDNIQVRIRILPIDFQSWSKNCSKRGRERGPKRMFADVRDGLISVDDARRNYGVVIDGSGMFDWSETIRLRA